MQSKHIVFTETKKPSETNRKAYFSSAVKEGFEPSVQLPVRQFSKLVLSASQAPHLYLLFLKECKCRKRFFILKQKRIKLLTKTPNGLFINIYQLL